MKQGRMVIITKPHTGMKILSFLGLVYLADSFGIVEKFILLTSNLVWQIFFWLTIVLIVLVSSHRATKVIE